MTCSPLSYWLYDGHQEGDRPGGGGALDFEMSGGVRRLLGLKNGLLAKVGAKKLKFKKN